MSNVVALEKGDLVMAKLDAMDGVIKALIATHPDAKLLHAVWVNYLDDFEVELEDARGRSVYRAALQTAVAGWTKYIESCSKDSSE